MEVWQACAMAHKPSQLTSDVSQLLSMLTAGLGMGTPCINTFSGDATPERLKYLLSSGITRSGASRTTTQRQWSGKVLSSH